MRAPAELSYSGIPHVLIGPDAGFPWCQPLDEWKGDIALVNARSLSSAMRAAAGIKLPEERLAECEELDRWSIDAGTAPMFDEDMLSALRVAGRARLQAIDRDARRVLAEHGAAFWVAGYSRVSATMSIHRVGGPEPFALWALHWDTELGGAPPASLPLERFQALASTRWMDRVLRALSGGAVSEPALLFAQRQLVALHGVLLVEDEVAHAGVEAAKRMAAGDDVVDVPLHGPVRRVRLPGFTQHVLEADPNTATAGEPCPRRAVEVPAEDVYVRMADVG
ncbi:Hypothetical protein A7982_04202 [Minicystis rosea]|nr:Hypothetical protein A7982_04202 [Minicystis rosea]